jgi:hypothetical protein
MLLYIKNLLPRLRQYSQTLDKIELLVEHPWVLIDDEGNQQKYIFRRGGDLLMSINGKGIKGKWEYLTVAKSLWIDRGQDNIMLNHGFVNPAVMILQMDGNKEMPFVLANENLIPDMDVVKYLEKLVHQRPQLPAEGGSNNTFLLKDGRFITIHTTNWAERINTSVTIDGEPIPDGTYELADNSEWYTIEKSKIRDIIVLSEYSTNKGTIYIRGSMYLPPIIGNNVFQGGGRAPDGKYRIGFGDHIHVKNGRIENITFF